MMTSLNIRIEMGKGFLGPQEKQDKIKWMNTKGYNFGLEWTLRSSEKFKWRWTPHSLALIAMKSLTSAENIWEFRVRDSCMLRLCLHLPAHNRLAGFKPRFKHWWPQAFLSRQENKLWKSKHVTEEFSFQMGWSFWAQRKDTRKLLSDMRIPALTSQIFE